MNQMHMNYCNAHKQPNQKSKQICTDKQKKNTQPTAELQYFDRIFQHMNQMHIKYCNAHKQPNQKSKQLNS